MKVIFTKKTASRPFGFLTSTVAYGSAMLAHRTSAAVPFLRGRGVVEGDAVGVDVWVAVGVGRGRDAPFPGDPDELSWS
ncbi:hypothetical protein GCM10023100_76910 [Actinocorallia cavernae]|uniref:Uncharacterized protein n=2 Tax=Actinomycetes TaxID=1760 RepID=A0ABP5XQH7_9ACTN